VESIFEEIQSDSFKVFCGAKEVVIDLDSIVHIFWRHYAGIAKQYNTRKSFHLDDKIKHFKLPSELSNILKKLGNSISIPDEVNFLIPLKIRGVIYSVWTKKAKRRIEGNGLLEMVRLQTFYPTEEKSELKKIIDDYTEIVIDTELSVFKVKNAE
jgi:hypothetical protein